MAERTVSDVLTKPDAALEMTLRPSLFSEFTGQAKVKERLEITNSQGPNAPSVRLNLPRFTLIGATTRSGLLTAPLLTRFGVRERLDYYQAEQLQQIVVRSARLLNIEIEEGGAREIARRSRGTPRIANNLLRRVRDYAQVRGDGKRSEERRVGKECRARRWPTQ